MATGKGSKDIFTSTARRPEIGLEAAPRIKGRPRSPEALKKVTVCLHEHHVLFLDRLALTIREKTGKAVRRAALIRALVDQAADTLKPETHGFEKAILPILEKL